jgi:hypothetical protein
MRTRRRRKSTTAKRARKPKNMTRSGGRKSKSGNVKHATRRQNAHERLNGKRDEIP